MSEYYMIMLDSNKRIPMLFDLKGVNMSPIFPTQAEASRFAVAYAYDAFFIREVKVVTK